MDGQAEVRKDKVDKIRRKTEKKVWEGIWEREETMPDMPWMEDINQ